MSLNALPKVRMRRVRAICALLACLALMPRVAVAGVEASCEPAPVAAPQAMSCHETQAPLAEPHGRNHCLPSMGVSDCCCMGDAPAGPVNRPTTPVSVCGPQSLVLAAEASYTEHSRCVATQARFYAVAARPPGAPLFISHHSLLI